LAHVRECAVGNAVTELHIAATEPVPTAAAAQDISGQPLRGDLRAGRDRAFAAISGLVYTVFLTIV
jgi:hypothetical protein